MDTTPTTLGHVHLKVRDPARAEAFYREVLGLEVTERVGTQFLFMSSDDRHHMLALQALGPDAAGPHPHQVGLYHTAWEVPDLDAFARKHRELTEAGIPFAAVDHRISWALYFTDPDGNGVEIYADTRHLDEGGPSWEGVSRPLPGRKIQAFVQEGDLPG